MLPQEVIEMLRDKSGSRLRYWLDINVLCMDIKRETGQTLSIVTMKRLLGLIDGEYKTSIAHTRHNCTLPRLNKLE
jgi:hypothetical protein